MPRTRISVKRATLSAFTIPVVDLLPLMLTERREEDSSDSFEYFHGYIIQHSSWLGK